MNDIVGARASATATASAPAATRPRVVIVGAGFGGLWAAKGLADVPVDVVVVDRRNYHLFQPLLYQVATAGLAPADIAYPIRNILRDQANTRVLLGRVVGIDIPNRTVITDDRRIPYDYLVLATGARHAYFGHDEWESFAPGLKKIDDATDIRRRILLGFEQAETTHDETARRRLLNFVIVGGGPTGVEMAGAIAELAHAALVEDFRAIDPREARIILVEAGDRILPALPPGLSAKAKRSLEKLGVEVRVATRVVRCDEAGIGIQVGDREGRIESGCVIWAAGVAASPAAKWLGVAGDRAGRVPVRPDLSVENHPEIFVIGDTALVVGPGGKPLPGIAPVAKQEGAYVARLLRVRLKGMAIAPFRYKHVGDLATIGRKAAVADFGWIRLSGALAWFLWGAVHIFFLIGFRNRLAVLLNWLWAYISFHRSSRLITGPMT